VDQQPHTTKSTKAGGQSVRIQGLEGVSGKLQIDVQGSPSRVFEVRDGTAAEIGQTREPIDATVSCDNEADCLALLSGDLNPIVAALQGRVRTGRNSTFAAKVLLGLHSAARARKMGSGTTSSNG